VCALFPVVRVLYRRLRDRVVRMIMQDIVPTRTQAARQQQQQQQQQRRGQEQEQQPRERPRRLRVQIRAQEHPRPHQQEPQQQRQQQQQQQQQQQPQRPQQAPAGPGAERRFHFQVGGLFGFEIAHFVFDHRHHVERGVQVQPAPAPAVAVVDDAVNGDDGRAAVVDGAVNGDDGGAVDNPADQEQQPHRDGRVQEPERDPPALVPADQDQPEQQQQQPPAEQQQQPPAEQQQQQRVEPGQGQGQGQEPVPPARDEEDLGAVAARAIGLTGASLGRLVGGALLMPTIARMMGSMLLQISHVVPLIRTIIAPLPAPLPPRLFTPLPSGPISALLKLIRGAPAEVDGRGWLSGNGLGTFVLRGLLATSQEWATSDPVWYAFSFFFFFFLPFPWCISAYLSIRFYLYRWRNTLGLGIFLVVS
jgi:hypothetical protein